MPIQRAIRAGDDVAGVSIMRMEEGLDTGPYCLQASTPIAEKTATDLTAEVAEMGASALLSALPTIADGTAAWTLQDDSLATYADKVAKADVAVSPDMTAVDVVRRVRASLPAAPSRALVAGRPLTLLSARVVRSAVTPGAVASVAGTVLLGASDGAVELVEVKPDGKAAMDAGAWGRGVRDLDGATWGAI